MLLECNDLSIDSSARIHMLTKQMLTVTHLLLSIVLPFPRRSKKNDVFSWSYCGREPLEFISRIVQPILYSHNIKDMKVYNRLCPNLWTIVRRGNKTVCAVVMG